MGSLDSRFLTGTHLGYFRLCPRKAWLFDRGIRLEDDDASRAGSGRVALGRLNAQSHYQRRAESQREPLFEWEDLRIRPDFFDPESGRLHETKLSSAQPEMHRMQLQFYAYVLEQAGFEPRHLVLEYPEERRTEQVDWGPEEREYVGEQVAKLREVLAMAECPPPIKAPVCRKCAYYAFCYAEE